jgi:uncharacterized protein (DUF849 family)
MEKLIINVALIGNTTTRDKNPNPPMTPREIAESAIESYQAGAAVCHVHVRDPITQITSMNYELYREVFERIREKCDMVINLTTGTGGRLFWDPQTNVWDTSGLKSPEERVEHVVRLQPEICSLDISTLNMGNRAFVNLVPIVEKMAAMIRDAGVKPELEVFEPGDILFAKYLVRKGLVENPPLLQLCLGIPGGIGATLEDFNFMRSRLPENALWCAFGVGPAHFPIASAAIIAGGHARVGFEDNLYISKGVLATSNAQQVQKVVKLANMLDREVATASEARRILGVNKH